MYVFTDLIRVISDIIGRRDDRAFVPCELGLNPACSPWLRRMQQVPALGGHSVTSEFVETRRAPDIGDDAKIRFEQVTGGDDLAQDRPRTHELHAKFFLRSLAAVL